MLLFLSLRVCLKKIRAFPEEHMKIFYLATVNFIAYHFTKCAKIIIVIVIRAKRKDNC